MEQLEHLRISQQSKVTPPSLFDSSNVEALFRLLDPTGQQHITFAQYKQGEHNGCSFFSIQYVLISDTLKYWRQRNDSESFSTALTTLGITDINECPDGVNEDRISYETFRTEA